MFGNLIAPRYPEVDATLADEGGDIGCRKEHKGDGVVLHECNVEAAFTPELDVRPGEKVERCGLEAAFCEGVRTGKE